MNRFLLLAALLPLCTLAQKKPLDHTVYDAWENIGERLISNDGKWIVYTVTPQEGDASLYIQSATDLNHKKNIGRGYNALITEDSRFLVFRIKPLYKETRDARIKKKKPEDLPKDSIGIVELGKDGVFKIAKITSYKTPAKASGWVAYHKERENGSAKLSTPVPTQKTVDSLKQTIDSLVLLVKEIKNVKAGNRDMVDADEEPASAAGNNDGSDLVLRNLNKASEQIFKNVVDYQFNAYGQKLLIRTAKAPKDSASQPAVIIYDLQTLKADTILRGGNDFKSFALTENGQRAAFLAERDTALKAPQKFYQLFLYQSGDDSAHVLIDKKTIGMQLGMTVSEWGNVSFSKSGNRLLFGTAPIQPAKDTSLVDIDLVKVDVWHYKDDYLQTQQLFQLNNELKRNYLAAYDFATNRMEQLGSKALPTVLPTNEGDGAYFIAVTDTGRRIEAQWSGLTKKDIYAIDVTSGRKTLVRKNHYGQVYASAAGKYILLYDSKARHYFAWDGKSLKNISASIKTPLYNEEHDTPGEPSSYGVMGWHQADSFVYVYDRFDVWKIDPTLKQGPVNLTKVGRTTKTAYRYQRLDAEERHLVHGQALYFKMQNDLTKKTGVGIVRLQPVATSTSVLPLSANNYSNFAKAKHADRFVYTSENYVESPNLFLLASAPQQLSTLNTKQAQYNWGTAELVKWKTFNGKQTEGILYKPEDFDPTKKYPMILYFYEKLSDGLYTYQPPAPTGSRLNIPFFVSRGYLVFAPDISYTKGHPAKDAYNYIVSGVQMLTKNKWVDAKNIAIQGQSWGGYQVMTLITQTNQFKAAWAGAPVVNMTSAYGGIRWESGNNRQSQYEMGQSRIGSSLWEQPALYIENSPLFHLKKVKTPVVIMANDADGAVPWYQGIEAFTAMRRLGKQVWMLNYNGEAHNLVERKNKKDIQIRQQQYFDWLLKGEKAPEWIVEGLPAVKKGKDWGLEIVD